MTTATTNHPTPLVPMMNTLDYPMPKFYLGQQVDCEFTTKGEMQARRGVVIGLEYISIEYALKNDESICGWRYTITNMYGKPDAEWLKVRDPYDVHWDCIEPEMRATATTIGGCEILPVREVA